jgi:hypothetical protein
MKHRFFGSSSGFMLVKNALTEKVIELFNHISGLDLIESQEEYLGRPIVTQFRRPEFWHMRPVSGIVS